MPRQLLNTLAFLALLLGAGSLHGQTVTKAHPSASQLAKPITTQQVTHTVTPQVTDGGGTYCDPNLPTYLCCEPTSLSCECSYGSCTVETPPAPQPPSAPQPAPPPNGPNTPVLTSISPNTWPSGQTTPNVIFNGYNFGSMQPTLKFSPSAGITYTYLGSTDSAIVANITVAPGVPTELVNVTVTSNGNARGLGFIPVMGGVPTSAPATAAVVTKAPVSPEVVVIGWVNKDAVVLPAGANPTLVHNLVPLTAACYAQIGAWTTGVRSNVTTAADQAYANAWLVKASPNKDPGLTINANAALSGKDFRLINVWGGTTTVPTAGVGNTPDPCQRFLVGSMAPVAQWFEKGELSQYDGQQGYNHAGYQYQLAEGRAGTLGNRGYTTINPGRTLPWIWSAPEFDVYGHFMGVAHEIFPTYSIYVNGKRTSVAPQSDPATFFQKQETNQVTSGRQIP